MQGRAAVFASSSRRQVFNPSLPQMAQARQIDRLIGDGTCGIREAVGRADWFAEPFREENRADSRRTRSLRFSLAPLECITSVCSLCNALCACLTRRNGAPCVFCLGDGDAAPSRPLDLIRTPATLRSSAASCHRSVHCQLATASSGRPNLARALVSLVRPRPSEIPIPVRQRHPAPPRFSRRTRQSSKGFHRATPLAQGSPISCSGVVARLCQGAPKSLVSRPHWAPCDC